MSRLLRRVRPLRWVIGFVVFFSLAACGGGGGGGSIAVPPVVLPSNAARVVLDSGPTGKAVNAPYVTVTVCNAQSGVCQSIDHVLVDTGSVGLRLMNTVLNADLNLPVASAPGGGAYAECGQFASGFTWGSVRTADVKIGGEIASALPVQIIGDAPGGVSTAPGSCGSGPGMNSVANLGANGILGIGQFVYDCDICHVRAAGYYVCAGNSCSASTIPASQTLANPVARFSLNNNGSVLALPSVGVGGALNPEGTLSFGINTQSNNQLGAAAVIATSASGNFTTTFAGTVLTNSFMDSGSNALFFDTAALDACRVSIGFYCPALPTTMSATLTGRNGVSQQIDFSVVSADSLSGVTAAPIAGAISTFPGLTGFDWGLPFFFGRSVFTAIEGAAIPGRADTGPFLAYR